MQHAMIETVNNCGKKVFIAKAHIVAIKEIGPGDCVVITDATKDDGTWYLKESADSMKMKYDNKQHSYCDAEERA